MTVRFKVERLGAGGDGVAEDDGQPVFIPFTLPGEEVTASRVRDRATLNAVLAASPLRVEPPCRHFGDCGGCALQHMELGAYLGWKRDVVAAALASRGIGSTVLETIACAPQSRRRVRFSLRRTEAGMLFGYHRALSATIVDIEECPIALPSIVARKEALRTLGAILCATGKPFRMAVTETLTGPDVFVTEAGKPTAAQLRAAADHAIRAGLARLSFDGQIVVEPIKPVVRFGAAEVTPPPGGFLQAVDSAEDAMAGLVLAHLGAAKTVADLYAGCGAFALRLAVRADVHAVESDAAALAALDRGSRSTQGLRRVTTERRDLDRRPLIAKELNAFAGIVFDPPRAGAEEQVKQLALSDVPLVAAVSCNPATLARDLRILIDGGYRLRSVTPVDQFLWSPHVEAVALLDKPRKTVRRSGW